MKHNVTFSTLRLIAMTARSRVLRGARIIPEPRHCTELRSFSGSRGFSLMELVVFMVAASVIIGGILYPFIMGVRDFEKPDEMLRAVLFAQSVMEECFHAAFDDRCLAVTPGAAIADFPFPDGYSGTKSVQYVGPENQTLDVSGLSSPYKKIEITITTPSSRTVSLQGIVSRWSYEEFICYQ